MANSNGGFGGVIVGKPDKPTQTTAPDPEPKPNDNLTAAMRASLSLMKHEDDQIPSPLNEATPDSVDILLDRINTHMIEGKILTDEDLRLGIDLYRAQALKYSQEQQTKKPRARPGTKATLKQVLDLDELEFGDAEPEQ